VVDIAKHLLVGEAHDLEAGTFEQFCTRPVIFEEPIVLFAIDLDDEFRRMTIEADDEIA
jgi:hypothetical protein